LRIAGLCRKVRRVCNILMMLRWQPLHEICMLLQVRVVRCRRCTPRRGTPGVMHPRGCMWRMMGRGCMWVHVANDGPMTSDTL